MLLFCGLHAVCLLLLPQLLSDTILANRSYDGANVLQYIDY